MKSTDDLAVKARSDTIEIATKRTDRTVAVLDPEEASNVASMLSLAAHTFAGKEEGDS